MYKAEVLIAKIGDVSKSHSLLILFRVEIKYGFTVLINELCESKTKGALYR